MDIPVLATGRLILRGHRSDDFNALHALWCEPAVYAHISGEPSTREASWARLLRYAGMWPMLGYGYWAITDRHSGAYIGDIGFCDFHRHCEPPLGSVPEMGWVLSPAWHGQGLGREAVTAALAWADAALAAPQLCCIISPENAASIAIARHAGFVPSHPARYRSEDISVYRRQRTAT